MHRFTFYDYFLTFISAATYIADFATDIALIVYFFTHGYQIWGSISMTFVALAAIVMLVFSFHWQVTEKTLTFGSLIIHLCFLAPSYRYLQILHKGRLSRKSGSTEDITAVYKLMNDVSLLRMFSTFLASVPQLVLQLYIVLSNLDNFNTLIGFSTVFSLLSVSWSVTVYMDALHLAAKKFYKRCFISMFTYFVWQTGMATARVVSIILFATALGGYVGIPLALHFVTMLIWINKIQPKYESSGCERGLSTIFLSFVHTLLFLKQKDGSSRYRMTFFYILTLVETGVFMVIWYMFKSDQGPIWFDVTAFSVVFGSFGLGALSMLLYYGCCHPSGPAPLPNQKPGFLKPGNIQYQGYQHHNKPDLESQKPLKENQITKQDKTKPTIFDVSSTSARINLWLSASLDLSKEGLIDNPDNHLDPSIQQGHQFPAYNNRLVSDSYQQSTANVVSPNSSSGSHSVMKPLLGRSHQTSFLERSGYRETSSSKINETGDRLDYSHASKMTDREYSIPDSNIVEMFSRCKIDPSFVSNESMSEILFNQTLKQNSSSSNERKMSLTPEVLTGLEQNNSLTYIKDGHWNSSRVSNNSSKSLIVSTRTTPDKDGDSGVHPLKFSPLDPSKLWEESEQRLGSAILPNSYLFNNESDSALNKTGEKTTVLTVTPDSSRGITHLSLSYSDLNSGQKSGLENSVFKHEVNKSVESMSSNSIGHGQSKLLSFSDESLQLPDDSADNNRNRNSSNNQPDIVQSVSLESHGSYKSVRPSRMNKSSTDSLDRSCKTRSIDSFNSRECSSDMQPSYLSDRGLASSDHALSSSASTNDLYGHRSLTSSGFQSEESNLSVTSPKHKLYPKQLHCKPLVENEISSISLPVSTSHITNKRISLDQDVFPDSTTFKNSTPIIEGNERPKPDDITPITREDHKKTSMELPPSALFHKDVSSSTDSPILPPIGWSCRSSSTGSSASGRRFFKDLSDSDGQDDIKSNEDIRMKQSGLSNCSGSNSYLEKSSLSNLLSDMSSFKQGGTKSSVETLSSGSDIDSLKRSTHSQVSNHDMNRASSLPYIPDNVLIPSEEEISSSLPQLVNNRQSLDKSLSSIHEYENIENYSVQNGSGSSLSSFNLSGGKIVSDYLCNSEPEKHRMQELFNEYSSLKRSSEKDKVSEYMNINELDDMDDERRNNYMEENTFKRDKWRSSLDKEMTKSLVKDIERLAPKKLYQLQSKSAVPKKLSPVKISEYSDSPYKFRKSKDISPSADYVNIEQFDQSGLVDSPYKVRRSFGLQGNVDDNNKRISLDGINSDPENPSLTHSRNYENINKLNAVMTAKCPIASTESLSDSLILDDLSNQCVHGDQTYSIIDKIRNEMRHESPCDSLQSYSSELSRTRSPINTSGVNSAFKPVKTKHMDSQSSSSTNSRNSSGSDSTMDSGVCKSRSTSNSSRNGNNLYVNLQEKSDRLSDSLQYSCDSENVSSFQWIQNTGVSMLTGLSDSVDQPSRNYLRLNITPPSCLNVLNNETASQCSKHSYTDSIPWEESMDKSCNSSLNGVKPRPRQALKSLENTPVFSPIYGHDNNHGVELSTRTRFMSTPKMSSNKELSISKNSEDSFGGLKTPRRISAGASMRASGDNTSTWSSQCDSDVSDHMGHSTFALSKTTYI